MTAIEKALQDRCDALELEMPIVSQTLTRSDGKFSFSLKVKAAEEKRQQAESQSAQITTVCF